MRVLFHSASRADRYLMEKVAEPWGDDGRVEDGRVAYRDDFDCIVVLGDRLDTLTCATLATTRRVPVAHIHGGEITRGSTDNRYRNAISCLADIHFVATLKSRARIPRCNDWEVHHVGAPGLDGIEDVVAAPKKDGTHALVTVSPALGAQDFYSLYKLLDLFEHVTVTASSVEHGSGGIDQDMQRFCKELGRNRVWHKSLGHEYLPTLKSADVCIGNSSSGIIEAPSLGTPTINIGSRQDGRECADSVHCCGWDELDGAWPVKTKWSENQVNPYHKDGKACESIHRILTGWLDAQGH